MALCRRAHRLRAGRLDTARRLQQLFNFRRSQRQRRISLNFSGKAIGHVSQEQHPKGERESEQRKLEREG